MEIIGFYESGSREHWLSEIHRCEWDGGKFLYELLSGGKFFDTVGEGSEVFMLTDGDKLVSFCTYAKFDDIQPTELSPWIGFVYTFPQYRGYRYMGLLFERIEQLAKTQGVTGLYLSTDHTGLYEKYGFEYLTRMKSVYGDMSRVYIKRI